MMSRMEYTLALDGDHIHVRIERSISELFADFSSGDHAFHQGLHGQQQDHFVSYQCNSERQTEQEVTVKLQVRCWKQDVRFRG